MSLYIIVAIIAYSLFAINGVIDKFLLSKAVRSPAVYAFFIGITGPLTIVLAPFDIAGMKAGIGFYDLLIAIAGGASFIIALYYLYSATQKTSISRILPIEGGLVPVFTLIFTFFVLPEDRLTDMQFMAFLFLVLGAVLISLKQDKGGNWHPQAMKQAVLAAIFFALHFTLMKYTFEQTAFIPGLIYTRLGFLVVSLAFLIPKDVRHGIFNAPKSTTTGNKFLYYGARITGSVGGFLQNWAISLGSVTIVNAMQGTQYALLLLGTIFLSKKFPKILKEKITGAILAQKIFAILLISFGLVLLTIYS